MRQLMLLLIVCFAFSCSTKKVTKVSITNQNAYPISVRITTNNISQTFSGIKPNEEREEYYDWTTLEKKDGQWVFRVENENTKGADEYTHGYYADGELFNYVTLICKGDQLKVQISE